MYACCGCGCSSGGATGGWPGGGFSRTAGSAMLGCMKRRCRGGCMLGGSAPGAKPGTAGYMPACLLRLAGGLASVRAVRKG